MIEIDKSRPQREFEQVWVEAFSVLSLAWETTLAYHTSESEEAKEKLFSCLKTIDKEMQQTSEMLYSKRHEMVKCLYGNCSELHNNEWYLFISGLTTLIEQFNMSMLRFFLFKDVLLQINEQHPKRKNIEQVFNNNLNKLAQIKALVDDLLSEEMALATHDSIVVTRAIGQNISLEQAEENQNERWL